MGQDDSCGICGKHYQTCKHHTKEHISWSGSGMPMCGSNTPGGYVNFDTDTDEEDICKRCRKSLAALARDDFQHFMLVIQENR